VTDGGTPVQSYQVERMDESTGRWVPAGETDGKTTSFDVDGLTPGHKYKFRVFAVNVCNQMPQESAEMLSKPVDVNQVFLIF